MNFAPDFASLFVLKVKFVDEMIQDDTVCEDAFENAMTNLVAQLLVDLDWVLRSSGMTAVS